MTEAVAHARNGLDVLSGMPNSTLRQEQELDLQITLGKALMATKGFSASEPGEAFARARQLCEQLSPSPQLGRVLYGQWLCRVTRGDLDQAEQHAERLRQLGEAQNYVMWKCLGSRVSGVTCFHLGRFIEGRAYLQNALSLQTNRTFTLTSEDPDAMIASFLSLTLLCLGHVDQAQLRQDEALAEARRVSPHILANTLYLAWLGAWVKGGGEIGIRDAFVSGRAIGHLEGAGIPDVVCGWELYARLVSE